MKTLSKSKILAYRQCPKRLWLELHKTELRDDSASEAVFAIGNQVGDIARTVFDPEGNGVTLDVATLGHAEALAQSVHLLAAGDGPIFEAGLKIEGALAYADVMLPDRDETSGDAGWHLIEVKSSSSVKRYQLDDLTVQSFIAREMNLPISSLSIAHINTGFVYPGNEDYDGLFTVVGLTSETKARHLEAQSWFEGAHRIAQLPEEPEIETGPQCTDPFPCPFCHYCYEPQPGIEFPLSSFHRLHATHRVKFEEAGYDDIRKVPSEQLSSLNKRIQEQSISGETYFDLMGARAALEPYGSSAHFLDFETIMFAVPIWAGTRPYQQVPFQYSLHRVLDDKPPTHRGFLLLTGEDPSRALALSLIEHCGTSGAIFAYNSAFESRVILALAARFPDLGRTLHALSDRLVDLLPIARDYYYHPSQHGSWSIKAVLPAAIPDLDYNDLDGVQDGGMAMTTFMEAIHPSTTPEHREIIRTQLEAYCELDTFAMVRLWKKFRGLE